MSKHERDDCTVKIFRWEDVMALPEVKPEDIHSPKLKQVTALRKMMEG